MRTIVVLVLAICFALVAAQEKEYSFELNAPKITLGYLKELIKHGERMRDVLAQKESVQAAEATEEAMSDSFIGAGQTVQATQGVNIRSGPCTNYRIVGGLSYGSTATATGSSSSGCGYTWYQIRGSFGTGYVASNFVRAVSSPSPAPTPSHGGSSGSLTVSQLRSIMPNLSSSKANEYISHINAALSWASINTCLRKSAFLAQLAHESADLRYMEEIASGAAYEGRRDLGNTQPGDGRRYKGRGPIQLTGRANYRTAGRDLGVDLEGNPTLAATPQWGFKVAAWYWKTRSLNQYADQGTQSGFDQVTRRINGGYNGKADRDSKWRRARSVLGC